MRPDVFTRFWAKVESDTNGDCWLWLGHRTDKGYGRMSVDGRLVRVHRLAYEHFVGPIPNGLQIDHLCRNRACVKPSHLEPVTNRENTLRGVNFIAQQARRTHCINGHEFTPENTRPRKDHPGRDCRTCNYLKNKRREQAKRLARRSDTAA